MTKENMPVANVNGRITRARATSLNASNNALPLRATKQQCSKGILQKGSKRAAPDENSASTSDVTCILPKKRAALRDVTNVCRETSYRSCFNASEVQAKNGSRAKKARLSVSKAATALSVEAPLVQAKSKTKIVRKTVKQEPNREVKAATALGKVVPSRFREHGVGDKVLKPCSRVPSKPLSPPKKVEKQSLDFNVVKSSDPDFIDIDCEQDPQLCSLYAADIYSNLRVAELDRRPDNAYMEKTQQDITPVMRGILVDWLVEVSESEEYKLEADTLYLTVNLIDRFLSRNYIERQRLQLLGITCMLIASKYEEICAPRVEEFCFITDNTYSREEVLKMETTVLKHFSFQIHAPTAKSFLRRFLRAAQAKESPRHELEYLADYLAELTLIEYNFLKTLPSVIAASAVFLARWTMDQKTPPWSTTLEHYTSYKASDIRDTVMALQELQLNTSGCPLNTVRMKYRQEKFKCVASLSSPKLQETLFE